ncbi:MAG: fibronectin/fibrinogen-binding protein, partial [Ignavibacterium sp.]|uniref:NFACT RNA binding domain-containing protein n=1 Tax=Ignavibacterium sp. TaxID=2651167 RepID=UPI00329A513A
NYINEFHSLDFTDEDYSLDADSIKIKYPFIGKDIFQYVKAFESKSLVDGINKVIEIIKNNNPIVIVDFNNYQIKISFKELPIAENENTVYEFDNLNDAILFYIKEIHHLASIKEKKELILKHIERELKRISNKQNNLLTIIERGNKEEEYNRMGNILLININKIHSGMNSIILDDIYESDQTIKIKLDPKLSPKENVNRYFEKAKESKTQYHKAIELIENVSREKDRLIEFKDKTLNSSSIKELEQIAKGLKIKMKTEKNIQESISEKFKHYIVDNKYKVYVGKDSKSNDLLTLKFAKQNDYWFHARAVPGSHVILRVENTKEAIPKSVLKKVASLAAYHSKAKTAGLVPVSYTFKKYVVKRKGMEPGKVALLKEDTILVTPEIPEGVEFVDE